MFDPQQQFFPTPKPVIEQMLAPYVETHQRWGKHLRPSLILDPSAGKGDILDYIQQKYDRAKRKLFAIEIDPELRHILNSKRYKVVESDFLDYRGDYHVDLVVMNPPFASGVEHLIHAWETLHGGDIACLLNAESVRNPCTSKRETAVRLIEDHGSVEFIGQAFKDAERPTDVEVALVHLHKEPPPFTLEFSQSGFDHDTPLGEVDFSQNLPAHKDLLESLVAQYDAAKRVIIARHQLQRELVFYTQPLSSLKPRWAEQSATPDEDRASLHEQLEKLKQSFWRYVFERTKVGQVTTSQFQKKFDQFQHETETMGFTVRNIREILRLFFENRGQIMEQCLLEVFDKATAYHEKNRIHWEGWKTNKAYKVNKRIIIPYGVEYDNTFDHWRIIYRNEDFFRDLDKVMCWLSGRGIREICTISQGLSDRLREVNKGGVYTEPFETTFFRVRFYKKGTLHLDFLDPFLLHEFNQRAAEGKNWLGGGY